MIKALRRLWLLAVWVVLGTQSRDNFAGRGKSCFTTDLVVTKGGQSDERAACSARFHPSKKKCPVRLLKA